ncbi:MAG TPA: tetratricopeptide repeat protein [bacterium]
MSVGIALALQGTGLPAAQAQNPPSPQPAPAAQAGPPTQLASVVLARAVKMNSLFGAGEVTPVDPTTSFFNTDLPYAVIKVKALVNGTVVTLAVIDPTGPAFALEVKAPEQKNGAWEVFDFTLPLYILGTDLESHTGTWALDVAFNGQHQGTTAFQMQAGSPIALGRIKDLLDLAPLDADLHWRYGAALALLHHDPEAIQELKNAIKLDRNYALYYISLGRLYERQGRTDDAVRNFKTALSLHGSYYDAVYSGWASAHLARLQTP